MAAKLSQQVWARRIPRERTTLLRGANAMANLANLAAVALLILLALGKVLYHF